MRSDRLSTKPVLSYARWVRTAITNRRGIYQLISLLVSANEFTPHLCLIVRGVANNLIAPGKLVA